VSNQPPSDTRAPEGLSPAARLFWSRFVRGLSFLAVAFAVVARIELALASAGPVLLDRCGHALRAIQVGPGHLPLAATAAVALCAVVPSAGAPGSRGRAAFIACACGALLASFEVSMRVANARKYLAQDARLGWCPGESDAPRKGREGWARGSTITPQGLRSLVATPFRWTGERVICLGDSFTFGQGVEDGEDWPAVASSGGRPFLNGGVAGYGIDQVATLYSERLALRFDHTRVIVAAIADDGLRATERFLYGARKPYLGPGAPLEPVPPPIVVGGLKVAPELQVLAPWSENARHLLRAAGALRPLGPRRRRARPDQGRSWSEARRVPRAARAVRVRPLGRRASRGRAGGGLPAAMRVDLVGCYLPDGHPDRRGHERIAAAAREAAK
jgi:hypothetical protein